MKFCKCEICDKIVAIVKAAFALVPYDKVKNVYGYCNLHGLWKA